MQTKRFFFTFLLLTACLVSVHDVRADEPQPLPLGGEGEGFITGTFQKTGDVPAFSAIVTEDPDDIREVNSEKLKVKNEGTTWHDLGGSRVPFPHKGGIYVTKGKSVLK